MTEENAAFELVMQHTISVLQEALVQEKFEGYRQAWKLEGSYPEKWETWYRLKGKINCNWRLYFCSLLLNQEEQKYIEQCIIDLPLLIEEQTKLRLIKTPQVAFDDYWYVWALGRKYEDYVSCYESRIDTSLFKSSRKPSSIMYTVSKFSTGNLNFEKSSKKALETQCQNSLIWHKITAQYPWWFRFIWVNMFVNDYMKKPDLIDVLHTLKGID